MISLNCYLARTGTSLTILGSVIQSHMECHLEPEVGFLIASCLCMVYEHHHVLRQVVLGRLIGQRRVGRLRFLICRPDQCLSSSMEYQLQKKKKGLKYLCQYFIFIGVNLAQIKHSMLLELNIIDMLSRSNK